MDLHGLPTNRDDLLMLLKGGLAEGQRVRNAEAVTWDITRWWLRGFRDLDLVDPTTGRIVANWTDPQEHVIFEETLGAVQEEIGRLMRVDLRPVGEGIGLGLDQSRKGAIAHAALVSLDNKMPHDINKLHHVTAAVHYGTAGLLLDETITPQKDEWRPRFINVQPWELLTLSGDVRDTQTTQAIVRQRWIPWNYAVSMAKMSSELLRPKLTLPSDISNLEIRRVPLGSNITFSRESSDGTLGASAFNIVGPVTSTVKGAVKTDDRSVAYVRLDEIWFTSDGETVDRYIVVLGNNYIAADFDYWSKGVRRPMPLNISRYVMVGGFYGRSFAYPRLCLNIFTERLLEAIIQNVEDFDQYGIILAPRNSGLRRNDLLRPRDGGPRFGTFEPDPFAPNVEPKAIQPVTTGNTPVSAMNVLEGVTNRVLTQQSIFSPDAPQRADGNSAINTIDRAASEPRAAASASIVNCWIAGYKALLDAARRNYGQRGFLPLVMLDEAMIGVVYDPKKGGVSLDKNSLPTWEDVRVSVRSRSMKSESGIAQWLLEAQQRGIITDRQFRIEVRKNGLDQMPVSNDAEWNAYQSAVLSVISAFNDGITPGESLILSKSDLLDVYAEVIGGFMNSPRFKVASDQVQKRLTEMLSDVRAPRQLPEGMPTLDDAAMQEQMRQRMMARNQRQMPQM